jgi:bifunctional non-homologous end joining protein LigD
MKTTLYYKGGVSDKVYAVEIKPDAGGHAVWVTYGRRNGHMTPLKKNKQPVTLERARSLYGEIVNEKLSEGYKPGEDSFEVETPTEGTAAPSGLPGHMLLKPITPQEVADCIKNDAWLMEGKFDGIRLRVSKIDNAVTGFSRTNKTRAMPKAVTEYLRTFKRNLVLDGELIGEEYICLDILQDGDTAIWERTAEERAGYVRHLFAGNGHVVPVTFGSTQTEKQNLYVSVHATGMEGLVFKRKAAPYTEGRGGEGLKFKFVNTCSIIAGAQRTNRDGGEKASFDMYLFDGTRVGSCTVPPNKTMPSKGSVVEVRYLYRGSEDGHLVQTVLLHPRSDVKPKDCNADQLQVKGAAR